MTVARDKKRATIHFEASEKLTAYFYDLIDEEGFGNNPTAVAQQLISQAIRQLINETTLTRRPGANSKD